MSERCLRASARRAAVRASVILIAGLSCGAVAQADDPPLFRAFWADAFSVGFKSQSEVNSMISRAVSGRYNAIIVEVLAFHDRGSSGHGAYWNSLIVPKAADITPSTFDPLAAVISAAHAQGIEVHAWIVPYRCSSVWPPSNNAYLGARPQWLMVPQANIGGGPATIGGYYTFDPGSPEVQEYLVGIVRELCANYEIDGINLDYIRYIQTDAGYPADANYPMSTLARFRAWTGYVGTPPPTGNTAWNDFRRQTIDEFVRRLRGEIPAIVSNPRQPLRLTADLIVFGNAPANFTSSDAYTLHQNWRMWMEKGWLDAGIPMNYKREHVSNEATWYRNWVNASLGWSYNRHMFSGVANYLNRKAASVTQMSYAITQGCQGVVNYAYDATADENINGTPEADWTWYTYVSANLYTQPAPTPAMPWRNPATATEGTLWGRVMNGSLNQPVERATVTVSGYPSVQTDGNGYYVITLINATQAGTGYTVQASSADCEAVQSSTTIVAGSLRRLDFVLCDAPGPPFGDFDDDNDIDDIDFLYFDFCMMGPDLPFIPGDTCLRGDTDGDDDLDLADMAPFQAIFGW